MTKVLMISGSPHENGNTAIALHEMEKIFHEAGVETEILRVGSMDIRGCIGCMSCKKNGRCVFDDIVNASAQKLVEADGVVLASPVYYGSANGTLISFLDRLFYSTPFDKTMKVGASIAVARRGGMSATYDELNKYFAISGMPIASGQYWNGIHGREPGEAAGDEEGLQQMRVLAKNMVFLMNAIRNEKERSGLPEKEEFTRTNFIR